MVSSHLADQGKPALDLSLSQLGLWAAQAAAAARPSSAWGVTWGTVGKKACLWLDQASLSPRSSPPSFPTQLPLLFRKANTILLPSPCPLQEQALSTKLRKEEITAKKSSLSPRTNTLGRVTAHHRQECRTN